MEIAMVGLGKMGANMTRRLLQGGHRVAVTTRNPEDVKAAEAEGAIGAYSLDELVSVLKNPGRSGSWCRPEGLPKASYQA